MLRDTQPPKSAQHNKKVGHQVAHTNFPNNFLRCNTQVKENLKKKSRPKPSEIGTKKIGPTLAVEYWDSLEAPFRFHFNAVFLEEIYGVEKGELDFDNVILAGPIFQIYLCVSNLNFKQDGFC